jgi:tetratricopeptide (TPR) repeat protein
MRPHRITRIGAALAILAGAAAAQPAPSVDTVVEARLLPAPVKAAIRRLADNAAPTSAAAASAEVRRLIEAGRASGDPRTLGLAESVLARWPAGDDATPADLLVLRATIEQSRHRFDAATTLLDRVLARPQLPAATLGQALLTRATIAQVRGHYGAAAADCDRLRSLNAEVAAICSAIHDTLTGQLDAALPVLARAAARTQGSVRSWALAALAQAHEQRGEPDAAGRAYRAALAASDDLAARLALADLLLAQREAAAAEQLLADAPEADGVLLRRWQAARLRGIRTDLEARLQARFDQAAARGDPLHARDAAVFALERGDPTAALRQARDNWAVQREPADLRVLARAARAARDAQALADVRAWLRATGLQDARLQSVLAGSDA